MGEVTGYNKEQVDAVQDAIAATYTSLCSELATIVHDKLVIPMSTVWYAPEAVDEFTDYVAERFKELGNNMQGAYQAYTDWVKDVGKNWADNTGGEGPSKKNIEKQPVTVDVSAIENDNGGNITLDEEAAKNIANSMEAMYQDMLAAAQAAHGKLDAATALMGHGQAAAATACFVKVADAIGQTVLPLTEALNSRITQYADKYKQVAEEIANKFNSAEIEVKKG